MSRGSLGPWIRRLRRRQRSRQGRRHAGADAPCYLLTYLTYYPTSAHGPSLSTPPDCGQRATQDDESAHSAARVRGPASIECVRRHDAATRCGAAATGLTRRSDDGPANRAGGGSGGGGGGSHGHRRGSAPYTLCTLRFAPMKPYGHAIRAHTLRPPTSHTLIAAALSFKGSAGDAAPKAAERETAGEAWAKVCATYCDGR